MKVTKEATGTDVEIIGSMTLRVETFVTKPILDKPFADPHTYGFLLNDFIVEQISAGNRVVGFDMELTREAADSLTDAVLNGNYAD